jgi:hypothetical protein
MAGNIKSIVGRHYLVATYLASCLFFFAAARALVLADLINLGPTGPREAQLNLYLYMVCAGGVGAVIYCIRGLYRHYSDDDYNSKYVYWYIFRPWVGAVLGLVSYFLIAGGLLAFSDGTPSDNMRTKALFMAVAFLAGFSSNEFIMKINSIAESLFGRDRSKSDIQDFRQQKSGDDDDGGSGL